MVKRKFIILSCLCFFNSAIAGPCDEYKKIPGINVKKAEWSVVVKPSDNDLWPLGGYISVQPFSSVAPNMGYMFNGKYYCVFLDSIKVEIGFKDFEITINKKYEKDTCEYNAVLEHEKHHMSDAEAALDKVFPQIEDALREVVNDIEPIYTEDADEVPYAMEKIQNQIMGYKKLKNLVEDFKEQQNKDAEKLDGTPDEQLMKCQKDKIDAAFEKYYKKKEQKQ